jgi:signal transduction histidine kinase
METAKTSLVLRSVGCRRCDAEASVRIGREFLCGSCAIEDLRVGVEPPIVLCDMCGRESALRLDERFLCGRCATALLFLEPDTETEVVDGFLAAVSSAIVGQREPAIAWAWELARRTRERRLGVGEAAAAYHSALAGVVGGEPPREGLVALDAASSVFGLYAAGVDGHLEALAGQAASLSDEVETLERTTDELRGERDELSARLRRVRAERANVVRHITEAKESERMRIAEEIHDDTIQALVAVQMRLQTLAAGASPDRDALEELSRVTSASIGRLRTLMFELRSDLLERYGLVWTLRELLVRLEERAAILCRLDDGLTSEPPPTVGANVYRIAQEAISNVRKHARASTLGVSLQERDGGVLGTVRDDGVGFDVGTTPPAVHAGLRFMHERAERTGGWVSVESADDGTSVRFWIPSEIGGAG